MEVNVAIIDADLIGRKNHRFPNLVCMKLSGYYKEMGGAVTLKTDYEGLDEYDKVFIAKVFTDTVVPNDVLYRQNVTYGGTGFFYDKAKPLSEEIEHHMPDYHLYDDFVKSQLRNGVSKNNLKFYTDYSIGYLTRGCFRRCPFCVNQNKTRVIAHSPIREFYDESRPKLCFLDDNFFGLPEWESVLNEVSNMDIPFQFRQGMDERILTDNKCQKLFSMRYDGTPTFAFDNIADKDIIIDKLKMIRRYTDRECRFYVLCAFDRNDKYDDDFWKQDIVDTFERIRILFQYRCFAYVMRYEKYRESPWYSMYVTLAAWCNQPSMCRHKTFSQFVSKRNKGAVKTSQLFAEKYPEIAKEYYNFARDCF